MRIDWSGYGLGRDKVFLWRLLGIAAAFCFFATSPLFAENGPDVKSLDWMTFYYKHPTPERLPDELRKISKGGLLSKPTGEAPFVAFLSQVMAQNPGKIAGWMNALKDLPEAEKKTLYIAIAFSHTAEGARFFESKCLTEYQKMSAPDILKMPIDNADVLDMCWGYFLATGKEEPVRRIISAFNLMPYIGALDKYKTSKKTDADRKAAMSDVILKAALWSLQSNCKQHPRVQEICESLLNGETLNDTERHCLSVMLGKKNDTWRENGKPIGDRPNMKTRDGFGAQLFLTEDESFFKEWAKPETPRLSPAQKARRNVPLLTVVLFADPGIDATGNANVTFDLTIKSPDGSLYGEQKGLVGWDAKYPTGSHNLQLAGQHLGIRIEPKDPAGTYTVEALVHDLVKKVDLALKTSFEVPQ